MKTLNMLAAISVILYVADHFAREIYLGYKSHMLESELRSERVRDDLRSRGLLP